MRRSMRDFERLQKVKEQSDDKVTRVLGLRLVLDMFVWLGARDTLGYRGIVFTRHRQSSRNPLCPTGPLADPKPLLGDQCSEECSQVYGAGDEGEGQADQGPGTSAQTRGLFCSFFVGVVLESDEGRFHLHAWQLSAMKRESERHALQAQHLQERLQKLDPVPLVRR